MALYNSVNLAAKQAEAAARRAANTTTTTTPTAANSLVSGINKGVTAVTGTAPTTQNTSQPLKDWGANSGYSVTYDAANNLVIIDGASFKPDQIPGTVYQTGGKVVVTDPSALKNAVTAQTGGELLQEENLDKNDQDAMNAWQLAANIRQNAPYYKNLFNTYGMTFTEDMADKLLRNSEDSASIWQTIQDMEQLKSFEPVHRIYGENNPFSLDVAKNYLNLYGTPEIMGKTMEAQGQLSAYGVDIKDLFRIYLQKDVNDQNILDYFMGKTSAPSFEKEYKHAVAAREGATTQTQTRTPLAWDEDNNLRLKGPNKSFV